MTLVDVDLEVEKSEGVVDHVETVVITTIPSTTTTTTTTQLLFEEEPTAPTDLPKIIYTTDPFATREGATLTWKNINMTLAAKRDSPERKILDNVWGEVPPHCTTAVMGPSGAGKTSLLNILAGRASTRGSITIQRTSVGVELVVKPAVVFLDEPTSGLDSYSAIQLCQVLKHIANAGASVLFTIHQPSSDIFKSFDNLILMNQGRVMYQGPVADVPAFFETRSYPVPPNYNPADGTLKSLNVAQSIPVTTLNEEGFFLEDTRDMGEAMTPNDGQDVLGNITIRKHGKVTSTTYCEQPPGMLVQTSLLFHREMMNLRRDVTSLRARFGLTIFLGSLSGVIFLNVGSSDSSIQSNIQSHFGGLIMVAFMSMFATAMPSLLAFPEERPVFLREYSTNHYSVVSYFISRLTMEAVITAAQTLVEMLIVYFLIGFQAGFVTLSLIIYSLAMASTALAAMLGCSVEVTKLGQELLPLLFVPQLLFSGFFVTPDLIPVWLRWAQYLCTLTYAIRLGLIAEFDSCHEPSCETLLDEIGANSDEKGWYWMALLGLFTFFRISALFILRKKATKMY